MTRLTFCLAFWLFSTVSHVPAQQTPSATSQQRELQLLMDRINALEKRQAASDEILKQVSDFLKKLETGGLSPTLPEPGCQPSYHASANQFLATSLTGCATFSADEETITFAISLHNKTPETLFLGARCCHGTWLKVIDNRGRTWRVEQATELPTSIDRDFVELGAGADILVAATVRGSGNSDGSAVPTAISITAEMLRRTAEEQRTADRARTALGFPEGRPLQVGLSDVPLASPR